MNHIYNHISKSNLCNYNNAYILVEVKINIIGCNFATEVEFQKMCTIH